MDTMSQIIGGVYVLLRRPSDIQLPPADVREGVDDELRGRVQDMDLGGRDHRTETALATVAEDDIDYVVSVPGVPDFEPVGLEYGNTGGNWYAATVVPLSSWPRRFSGNYLAASFYGGYGLSEGIKLRLNVPPDVAGQHEFRLTYRLPLLAVVQSGERPPIPANHLPMIKRAVAIRMMPLVDNTSAEWIEWMNRTLPLYAALQAKDEERWREYLTSSVEPYVQPIKPFNHYRRGGRTNARAYLPIGGN